MNGAIADIRDRLRPALEGFGVIGAELSTEGGQGATAASLDSNTHGHHTTELGPGGRRVRTDV